MLLEPSSDILLVISVPISMVLGTKGALSTMLALGINVPEGTRSDALLGSDGGPVLRLRRQRVVILCVCVCVCVIYVV